jgi:hypothetical protein
LSGFLGGIKTNIDFWPKSAYFMEIIVFSDIVLSRQKLGIILENKEFQN